MKILSKNPILKLVIAFAINTILIFFLIGILADGILDYKVGFIINTPIILIITYLLISAYIDYFRPKYANLRKPSKSIALILVGLLNLSLFTINIIIWIDLFDGNTKAMLP